MPIHGAILRPSAAFSSASSAAADRARSARRVISRFARPSAFSLPASRAAAASRISRNLSAFRVHYAIVLWFFILFSLFPSHRPTVLFLMAFSKIALSYAVLLRLFPSSNLLHRVLDRRLVAAVFLAVVLVQIAFAGAVENLLVALAAAGPIALAHAVFRKLDDVAAEDWKVSGDLAPASEKKDGDMESGRAQASDRSP